MRWNAYVHMVTWTSLISTKNWEKTMVLFVPSAAQVPTI